MWHFFIALFKKQNFRVGLISIEC